MRSREPGSPRTVPGAEGDARAHPLCRVAEMRYPGRLALLAAALLIQAGCCSLNRGSHYQGDGRLAAEMCWPLENYSLDFGPIDISTTNKAVFQGNGLPPQEWVVGLAISSLGTSECLQLRHGEVGKTRVSLRLADHSGEVWVELSDSLSEWAWSDSAPEGASCFVYSRKSSFEPPRERRFSLELAVTVPSATHVEASLWGRTTAKYSP